eukprot:1658761-Amphidinium_carterae.1
MPDSSIDPFAIMSEVLTSFSSWASSFPYVSGNEVPPPGSGEVSVSSCTLGSYSWYSYYTYYFDSVLDDSSLSCPALAVSLPLGMSYSVAGFGLVVSWLAAFGVAMFFLNFQAVCLAAGGCFRMVARLAGAFGTGIRADFIDVFRAGLFLVCEVLLVASRRTPIGKTKLRRAALRWRPYVAAAVADGSPAVSYTHLRAHETEADL